MGALSGVRIADFSWALAGPSATMMIASLGAEVIKIETRTRLDVTRHGPTFDATNRQKLAITLNMRHPKAIGLAKQLVAKSNAVVENFRPGVMDGFGLGYDSLKEVKRDIIMLSCSIAGSEGPYSRYAGYAPLFVALSGLGQLVGYQDGPPTEIRIAADIIVGMTNAVALLGALVQHQSTGKGTHIDLSAVEALASMGADSLLDFTMNNRVQRRLGNDDSAMSPHNCYRCKGEDSWVAIAIGTEEEWQAFVNAIGAPSWTRNPRFRNGLARIRYRNELDTAITTWTQQRTPEEAMVLLQSAGVAAVPSYKAPDLFGNPHIQERGATQKLMKDDHPTELVMPGGKLSKTPYVIDRPAAAMGEHNNYVLGTVLGLSESDIRGLEQDGVLE